MGEKKEKKIVGRKSGLILEFEVIMVGAVMRMFLKSMLKLADRVNGDVGLEKKKKKKKEQKKEKSCSIGLERFGESLRVIQGL